MQRENYIVYIAFGSNDFRNEALCSILSYLLLKQKDEGTAILIYTDNPAYFSPLSGATSQIIFEEVKPEQWRNWRGSIDFVHRIKIEVLLHAIRKYKGNILFLDSDTYFLQSPEPVFAALSASQRFMHRYESTLSTSAGFHRMLYEKLRKQPAAEWTYSLINTRMYNAGAIGLNSTDESLLEQVLALTDSLYRIYPFHVMEQLSFSMCLAKRGQIDEAAPYVLHYWHMKDTRPILADFFVRHGNKPIAVILQELSKLPIVDTSRRKDIWESRQRWQRVLLRMVGMGWKWPTVNSRIK